jgi:hypothetical protein
MQGRYPKETAMKNLTIATGIMLLSVLSASAQTPNSTAATTHPGTAPAATSSPAAQAGANSDNLRQQVQSNLTKAGFTDIKIMPTSFMVRAKDQSGNPVMMVINPDSFTEVTQLPANNPASQNNQSSTAAKH